MWKSIHTLYEARWYDSELLTCWYKREPLPPLKGVSGHVNTTAVLFPNDRSDQQGFLWSCSDPANHTVIYTQL